MSGIKRTNNARSKQNEYNLKGVTFRRLQTKRLWITA